MGNCQARFREKGEVRFLSTYSTSLFYKDIKESLINETANPLISIAVTKIADKQIDFT